MLCWIAHSSGVPKEALIELPGVLQAAKARWWQILEDVQYEYAARGSEVQLCHVM